MNYIDNELRQIDEMTGDDFELYMTHLLSKIGYKHMVHTPMVNDHGLDAYGYDNSTPPVKMGFQFKRYNHRVPYSAIYETIGGAKYYNTQINAVITNNFYSDSTKRTCRHINENDSKHKILLWDRYRLRRLIYHASRMKHILSQQKHRHLRRIQLHNHRQYYKKMLNTKFIKRILKLFSHLDLKIVKPKFNPYCPHYDSASDFICYKKSLIIRIKFILANKRKIIPTKFIKHNIKIINKANKVKPKYQIQKFHNLYFIITSKIFKKRDIKIFHAKYKDIKLLDLKEINTLTEAMGIITANYIHKYLI